MIKRSIQQGDIIIINVYTVKNSVSKYRKQKLTEVRREINSQPQLETLTSLSQLLKEKLDEKLRIWNISTTSTYLASMECCTKQFQNNTLFKYT